jgi:hypothetical protein
VRLKASLGSEQYQFDELVYRMIVRSLAAFRSQAVQHGGLRLFEIG